MDARHRQGRRAAAGTAILAGLLGLAVLIVSLDDIQRALRGTYEVVGVFEEGHRLKPGTEVWVAGRPVGRVTEVALLRPRNDGILIAARLEIASEMREQVRRDSRLRFRAPRLLAEPVVDIQPGTAAAPPLQPGDTLRAAPPPRFEPLLRSMHAFRHALDSLVADGRMLEERIDARAPAFDRLAGELAAAVTALDALTGRIERGPLAAFAEDTTWRASLARIETAVARIDDAFRERAAAPDSATLDPALRRLGQRADLLRARVAALRAALEAPRGFPGRRKHDPALRDALATVRAQLDSLAAELRQRPWRLFF
ncbi:MAG TPA: MlaD family protein [Longimicrobiales bacterium]